jgi:hypothetical protein
MSGLYNYITIKYAGLSFLESAGAQYFKYHNKKRVNYQDCSYLATPVKPSTKKAGKSASL